jgi:hypothetical protein
MSGLADAAGECKDPIEPVKAQVPGLETHNRTEIIKLGRNWFAGREPCQNLGGTMPQAFARDHNARTCIGLDHVARLDVRGPIAAYELPVGSAGQNMAVELIAFDAAAQDCNHASLPDGRAAHSQDIRELGIDAKNRFWRDHHAKAIGERRAQLQETDAQIFDRGSDDP